MVDELFVGSDVMDLQFSTKAAGPFGGEYELEVGGARDVEVCAIGEDGRVVVD